MNSRKMMALLLAGTGGLWTTAVAAQEASAPGATTAAAATVADEAAADDEILVTARKRTESAIDVPAVIAAFSGEMLAEQGATDIYKIAQYTPSLIVSQSSGATGGIISLRGVASGTGNATEQAVSINLDGVAVSNATALRIGQFDLKQVEVLKGPQALFFGKNSPGGVISFVSEGPGNELDGYIRSGYEFTADEWRTEAAIGGPLSESVGLRVAGFYGTMKGAFRNPLTPGFAPNVFGPRFSRTPNQEEMGGRVTLALTPGDKFSGAVKLAYTEVEGSSSYTQNQLISCPSGVPSGPEQIPGRPIANCVLDRIANANGDISPTVAALSPRFQRKPGEKNAQFVGSGSFDYALTDELSLSSVTGFYDLKHKGASTLSGPLSTVVLSTDISKKDASQELRLASDFGDGFDFMIGGLYQDSKLDYDPVLYLPTGLFNSPRYLIDGETLSAFGQASVSLIENLEFSGGVRYTHEVKDVRVSTPLTGDRTAFVTPNGIKVNDWSPEATLSYRPSEDVNLYGAYKEGFKSGGFVASITGGFARATDISYGPEHVRGFELGAKARLLDRQLRVNAALYRYSYDDLQVSAFDPVRLTVTTVNAASAVAKGIDIDFAYEPDGIEGLTVNGALAYNRARYGQYIATCYTGQTVAQGCNLLSNGTRFTSQDLTGRRATYSPDWAANLNFNYETAITDRQNLAIGAGLRHNSRYNADGSQAPEAVSRAVTFFDARVALKSSDSRWEVALVGRNLGDKLRPLQANDVSFTGTTAGLTAGRRADVTTFTNRPREILLQVTLRPF